MIDNYKLIHTSVELERTKGGGDNDDEDDVDVNGNVQNGYTWNEWRIVINKLITWQRCWKWRSGTIFDELNGEIACGQAYKILWLQLKPFHHFTKWIFFKCISHMDSHWQQTGNGYAAAEADDRCTHVFRIINFRLFVQILARLVLHEMKR